METSGRADEADDAVLPWEMVLLHVTVTVTVTMAEANECTSGGSRPRGLMDKASAS